MPVEFLRAGDGMRVRQSFDAPSVYLDHWAIRQFSDDRPLQDRFVSALAAKSGTLLLSNFTFAEFARPDDRRHTEAAEQFLERVLPRIFFTDFAFDKLESQEREEPDNTRRFPPPPDLPQLKLFAEREQSAPLGFTIRGFIAMARDNCAQLEPVTRDVIASIRSAIEASRKDPIYVKAMRNLAPIASRTRTRVIMAELMREFVLNESLAIGDNDIVDMIHATVPVNCCDFVLLDGAWVDRVNKLRQRIRKVEAVMPIAVCYSARDNGVQQFLSALEAFPCVTSPREA
jgi:hypothetical protein